MFGPKVEVMTPRLGKMFDPKANSIGFSFWFWEDLDLYCLALRRRIDDPGRVNLVWLINNK
jgi:hypothetical protein